MSQKNKIIEAAKTVKRKRGQETEYSGRIMTKVSFDPVRQKASFPKTASQSDGDSQGKCSVFQVTYRISITHSVLGGAYLFLTAYLL